MRGITFVTENLDRLRFRISRLIELERVPESEGRRLLWKILSARDLASKLEREKLEEGGSSGEKLEERG